MAIEKSKSPDQFISFERAGWDANIAAYDNALGAVSRQTVRHTLDAAGVRSGMRVLDICTGPGMMAEAAIARGAQATGLDLSPRHGAGSCGAGWADRGGDRQDPGILRPNFCRPGEPAGG